MTHETSLVDAFSEEDRIKGDRLFCGRNNCFRLALQNSETDENKKWVEAFQNTNGEGIKRLLDARAKTGWTVFRLPNEWKETQFTTTLRGLCLATAALLKRDKALVKAAVDCFAALPLVGKSGEISNAPLPDPIKTLFPSEHPSASGIEEFLQPFTTSKDANVRWAALVVRHLLPAAKADTTGVCHCPVAYSHDIVNASILRLIVRCLPSSDPLITPDLLHGGALWWSTESESDNKPGWPSITAVWEKLKLLCPGVRVSIGIEEWDENAVLTTPLLDGDSIQAATALAIWHAWHKTEFAVKRRAEIEKIDPRLPDFELDPTALVTAALDLQDSSPVNWRLIWVDNVVAKFNAASRCGLKSGFTARTKPDNATVAAERNPQRFGHNDAETFPELVEDMSFTTPTVRDYRKSNIDDWYKEFLNDAEAEAVIAQREQEQQELSV